MASLVLHFTLAEQETALVWCRAKVFKISFQIDAKVLFSVPIWR